jgi:hypothetical protein
VTIAGYYVDEYNSAMLAATSKGFLDEIFQVEEATPYIVAQLVGFTEEDVVFDSNKERVLKIFINGNYVANQLMKSKTNKYKKGQLSLDRDDLLRGEHGSKQKAGDRDL